MIARIAIFDQDLLLRDYSATKVSLWVDSVPLRLNPILQEYALMDTLEDYGNTVDTPISGTSGFLEGKSVSVSKEDGALWRVLRIDIPFASMVHEAVLEVAVFDQSDRELFRNSFRIFPYDLGNNPEEGIEGNAPFSIVAYANEIASEEFSEDFDEEEYAAPVRIVANMNSWRKPFSNELWFFDATSSLGDRSYWLADPSGNQELMVGSVDGFVCYGLEAYMRQDINYVRYEPTEEAVSGGCGCGTIPGAVLETYSEYTLHRPFGTVYGPGNAPNQHSIYNPIVAEQKWTPDLGLYASSPNCSGEEGCIVLDNEARAMASLGFNALSSYFIDDSESYAFDAFDVAYQVYSWSGELEVDTVMDREAPFKTFFPKGPEDGIVWYPKEVGDYLAVAESIYYSGGIKAVKCVRKKELKSLHWLEVTQQGCGVYRFHNRSFSDREISFESLQKDKSFAFHAGPFAIKGLEYLEVEFGTDNIYKAVFSDDSGKEHFYIIASYCKLRECLEKIVSDLLCKSPDPCKPGNHYAFLSIMAIAQTYFMLLAREYAFSFLYQSLLPSKLEELFDIKKVMDQVNSYCYECGESYPDVKSKCKSC